MPGVQRTPVEAFVPALALARDAGDNGTRELLESMLKEEEDSVDWHEAQLGIIQEIGKERYLAEQIHD